MTYKRRHQLVRFVPLVHSKIGAGMKALRIIKEAELTWEENAELDDAIEDLWILVEKLRAKEAK